MLKLAGQTAPAKYTSRFNTLMTKALLVEVLRQRIRQPQDVIRWRT